MMTPKEISYYILSNYSEKSYMGISPMKIQKLLFYVHVWGIVSQNKVFNAEFYKWEFGPVIPEIYQEFKSFGKNSISKNVNLIVELSGYNKKLVDFIVSNYIGFDAITLSSMTHQEDPWKKTKNDNVIDEKLIKSYYSKLNFAKNFPFNPNNPYFPVETDLHFAFKLDFHDADELPISYPSYKEYLEIEQASKSDLKNYSIWFAS